MNFLPEDFITNFHFLRPLFLYALIPAMLFFFLLRLVQGSQSNWTRAIDPSLLPYLLDKNRTPAQSLPLYGLLTVWILGIVAMAGPVWQEAPVPVQQREDALVIVLDMSMSMYATDVSPNRSTRAQRKVIDILEHRRQEGQTGLVVYAGDAHAVTPMTDDVETISNLVPSLQPNIMPILGSNPAAGIKLALKLLGNSSLVQARLLLMTDGVENSDVAEITSLLTDTGHTLSVLGFGTEGGSPIPIGQQGYLRDANNAIVIPRLERAPLQQLAQANGGLYSDAQLTDADIVALLEQNVFDENENLVAVEDREFDAWEEAGPWLLLLAIPLAALAFRRGWLFVLLGFMLVAQPQTSYAWEWRDMWERKDQQGSESFAAEDFASASTQFENPAWRAAANYRKQDYQAVVNDLSGLTDPESNYNRGNALAKLGQFESAIEAYDQTLAAEPDHADAQRNKEIVQKLLQQQQQEQQQQEQSGDQQQQEQDQGDQPQDQQNQDQQQQQSGDQQQQQQQQSDQQQQQAEEQQEQQNQEQAQQQESEQDQQQQDQQQAQSEPMDSEEEQAMQQWLMRIPDDPGELLRNKFRYQAQQEAFEQLQNPSQQPTNQRTW